MVVRENRAAYYRKRRVGTYEIVGKYLREIDETFKTRVVDIHRSMYVRKCYYVLIVVLIRRELQRPRLAAERNGNRSQRLSCRMIEIALVSYVVDTEHTRGIAALFLHLCKSYLFGVFFGF